MTKELEPVTMDTVRRLRTGGNPFGARDLLKGYWKNRRKERKQIGKEHDRQIREVKKMKGICTMENCKNDAVSGKTKCEKCVEMIKKNYQTQKRKRKLAASFGISVKELRQINKPTTLEKELEKINNLIKDNTTIDKTKWKINYDDESSNNILIDFSKIKEIEKISIKLKDDTIILFNEVNRVTFKGFVIWQKK